VCRLGQPTLGIQAEGQASLARLDAGWVDAGALGKLALHQGPPTVPGDQGGHPSRGEAHLGVALLHVGNGDRAGSPALPGT
jgi:hypothetical protein